MLLQVSLANSPATSGDVKRQGARRQDLRNVLLGTTFIKIHIAVLVAVKGCLGLLPDLFLRFVSKHTPATSTSKPLYKLLSTFISRF